jgi:uncharacterized membrane protein
MYSRQENKNYKWVFEMILIAIFVTIIFLLMESCKHTPLGTEDISEVIPVNNDSTGNEGNGGSNEISCDPDSVYFDNTILPLFISNCAKSGCHDAASAQDGIILNSYSNIINTGDIEPFNTNAGDIVEKITESDPDDRMPPPPIAPLTQPQINSIVQWINQGAQNNHCDQCDTLNVTYSGKIKPILDGKCTGCHSGSSPSGGISLSAYNGVQAVALNGRLFGAVNHSAGFVPMPQGGNKLPQCEIDAIRIWTDAGAPNN